MSNSVAAFELNSNFGISRDDGGISSKDDGVFLQNMIGVFLQKIRNYLFKRLYKGNFLSLLGISLEGHVGESRLQPCQKINLVNAKQERESGQDVRDLARMIAKDQRKR